MKKKIISYLKEIETYKGIKILLACETGSRAWGFPSPDSDYDIRLIYIHNLNWYLSLKEEKDTIEIMLDNNEIDIAGWDLRKTLRLLSKSNPALLERLQSSILYMANQNFLHELNQLAICSYSRIAALHHYLNMAKNFYSQVIEFDDYKLKSFFYALRASVICNWILDRTDIPPIDFNIALREITINKLLLNRIYELIELKAKISESYLHSGESELLDYISQSISKAEISGNNLPKSKANTKALNVFFQKMVHGN